MATIQDEEDEQRTNVGQPGRQPQQRLTAVIMKLEGKKLICLSDHRILNVVNSREMQRKYGSVCISLPGRLFSLLDNRLVLPLSQSF